MNPETLAVAVRHLLDLAVQYDGAHGGLRTQHYEYAEVSRMLRFEATLGAVVQHLIQHLEHVRAVAAEVHAAALSTEVVELFGALDSEIGKGTVPPERERQLRRDVAAVIRYRRDDLPTFDRDALVGQVLAVRTRKSPQKRVDEVLGKVVGRSAAHIADYRSAIDGKGRSAATVKNRKSALLAIDQFGAAGTEILRYVLRLIGGPQSRARRTTVAWMKANTRI